MSTPPPGTPWTGAQAGQDPPMHDGYGNEMRETHDGYDQYGESGRYGETGGYDRHNGYDGYEASDGYGGYEGSDGKSPGSAAIPGPGFIDGGPTATATATSAPPAPPVPTAMEEPSGPESGPGLEPVSEPASGAPAGRAPVRDRYFDFLRAIALFRVVLYHLTGWAWLPLVFPSMGVMFALAGNLMARSLKRPAAEVVRSRIRRLMPPIWLLGAVGVAGMVLQGWGPDADGHPGWWWLHLLFWIVPFSDPPYAEGLPGIQGFLGDNWAANLAGPLWYVRAYLWYVLLSPFLLRALRAMPLATILAPIALSAAFEQGYVTLPGERIPSALTDFSTFGACWILGMAHQEGILQRLPRYIVPSVAPAIALLGLWYAMTHNFGMGHDLDTMPLAQALWSFGTVLLLVHFSPSWSEWPRRLRRWDGLITLLNSRAVTIYLWHNICILLVVTQWNRLWQFDVMWRHFSWLLESPWPVLALTWVLIGGCVACFGWAEDLAAKRRPQLWPNGKKPNGKKKSRPASRGRSRAR